ncbi:MAG TPA: CopG family transcriptional regulator [Gammaproteobacteria bacterium]|nr:CopG family transcriptional regulator [Xanthomonadales bacterium]MCB1594634.1 CopG family transcriptional regulator [Xanthomonadales bacterium]HOP22024.1 CopG family transcriptional regulator [Gammaproteobacteria bacterium]HPI95168.1 CopG family transcriptional regulator [Gammaproteobacteria bacterium]HPQ86705.1 CopG family transcriptional regulator [Gammaproteobacteria bacterium]
MLTIRLDKDTEKNIERLAKQNNQTKSEFVRECLAEYIVKSENPHPYELGKNLFGNYSNEKGNLSQHRKQILAEILKEKHAKHSH